jgi:hypothetical protein
MIDQVSCFRGFVNLRSCKCNIKSNENIGPLLQQHGIWDRWRAAAHILNKQFHTADKGLLSGFSLVLTTLHH